jgi:membrane protease YdiL (CAAX protease family)
MILLTSFTAISLWQKMRDSLPYLQDPNSEPPSRVSTSDGMLATLAFFVIQNIYALAVIVRAKNHVHHSFGIKDTYMGFLVAGFTMFVCLQTVYFFYKTEGKPRFVAPGWLKSVAMGVLTGIGCAVIAFLYMQLVNRMGWFPELAAIEKPKSFPLIMFVAVVCGAPLFEEFLFRGVIFASLQRTWPPLAALVASAALFAVIHPPSSAFPVFCLGVAAAYNYKRSGQLIGSILTHATYNFLVVLMTVYSI